MREGFSQSPFFRHQSPHRPLRSMWPSGPAECLPGAVRYLHLDRDRRCCTISCRRRGLAIKTGFGHILPGTRLGFPKFSDMVVASTSTVPISSSCRQSRAWPDGQSNVRCSRDSRAPLDQVFIFVFGFPGAFQKYSSEMDWDVTRFLVPMLIRRAVQALDDLGVSNQWMQLFS
jgi:hypothetical protein